MQRERISRIFREQPTLETERLILRRILMPDAEDMYDYSRRSDVTEYLLWNPHPSLEYTREYLEYLETRYAVGDFFDWAVVARESGKMIGTCGFTRFRYEDDCGEVGYVFSPDVWGRGYAAEALNAVLTFGFEALHLERIEMRFIEGNVRSLRVAEKVGMRFEGYMRNAMRIKGRYRTIGTCAVLRGDRP